MKIQGGCNCGNIEIDWQPSQAPCAPRACQCDYCISKNASYVSEPNSELSAKINSSELHRVVQHGTNTADFHECSACNTLVFVSSKIGNETYGVINSICLPSINFELPINMHFSQESEEERLNRRRQNWCHPVLITITSNGIVKRSRVCQPLL